MRVNNEVVLVTTVEDEIIKYTLREHLNAKKACELPCEKTRRPMSRKCFWPESLKGKIRFTSQGHVTKTHTHTSRDHGLTQRFNTCNQCDLPKKIHS